jgi:chromatin assembly factor 1 subunit B
VPLAGSGVDKGKGKATEVEGEKKTEEKDKKKPKSLFDLPYRMVYAVATQDSVYLYDTQQAGPIAMFGGLHWQAFTDLTWFVPTPSLFLL